jgi:hypothetical protein
MTKTLPRLLHRKALAAELGISLAQAETLMRKLPKVHIGRLVFVRAEDVDRYLKSEART